MTKRYLYLMSGIQTFLGIYLFFLSMKYAFVESVMSQCFLVIIVGLFMIFSISRQGNESKLLIKKNNLLLFGYPIILVISSILIFTSIPAYTYQEATQIIENQTGNKTNKPKDYKASNGLYYIYTNEGTYIFNPWDGNFALLD